MDQLIERLRSQTDGLDDEGLDPAPALPSVIRRGRRYVATTAAAGLLCVVGAVGAVAVVGPTVMDQFREPTAPVILGVPESSVPDEPDPAPDATASADEEVDGGNGDVPDPEPSSEPQPESSTTPADDGGPAGDGGQDDPAPEPAPSDDRQQDPPAEPGDGAPQDDLAPELAVLAPSDGTTVRDRNVTFTGTVEPGASVEVGPYTATVDSNGSWRLTLVASQGENTVTFTATDGSGNTTSATRTVTYEPTPAPAEGGGDIPSDRDDGESVGAGFSARQQDAQLTSAPYKNVYSGTAPAGQKVAVTSQYGTAYVWADESGAWRTTVTFTPPPGTTSFPVTVKLWEQPDTRTTFNLTTINDAAPVAFTANQQRSELTSAPYTNTYSGTTTPGTKIKVLSDHGWAYAWADEAGNWEVTVTFNPPAGTTSFPVTARHYHDASVARSFTLTTVADAATPFTAGQQRDTVPLSAPSNTYGGTGAPGREVLIWTEAHGQTTTVIGADGTWAVTLVYANVAAGDRFEVKARDVASGTAHWFTVEVVEG